MIEVPAAALQADELAAAPRLLLDRDQRPLAVHRWPPSAGTRRSRALLEAAREPVLALIASVVAAAERHGRWVGVCGELAGDPEAALRLVADRRARAEHGAGPDPRA